MTVIDIYRRKSELNKETLKILTSSDWVELSLYNEDGYFHRVDSIYHFHLMKQEWERKHEIPPYWISKGYFPGIWMSIFDPYNTFTIAFPPIGILRFYFKESYYIFDPQNKKHVRMWSKWQRTKNMHRPNPWKDLKNERGLSLEERMKDYQLPHHSGFYQDHSIGAFIGYHDFISPVLINENSIKDVNFLVLE